MVWVTVDAPLLMMFIRPPWLRTPSFPGAGIRQCYCPEGDVSNEYDRADTVIRCQAPRLVRWLAHLSLACECIHGALYLVAKQVGYCRVFRVAADVGDGTVVQVLRVLGDVDVRARLPGLRRTR